MMGRARGRRNCTARAAYIITHTWRAFHFLCPLIWNEKANFQQVRERVCVSEAGYQAERSTNPPLGKSDVATLNYLTIPGASQVHVPPIIRISPGLTINKAKVSPSTFVGCGPWPAGCTRPRPARTARRAASVSSGCRATPTASSSSSGPRTASARSATRTACRCNPRRGPGRTVSNSTTQGWQCGAGRLENSGWVWFMRTKVYIAVLAAWG